MQVLLFFCGTSVLNGWEVPFFVKQEEKAREQLHSLLFTQQNSNFSIFGETRTQLRIQNLRAKKICFGQQWISGINNVTSDIYNLYIEIFLDDNDG